MLELAKQYAALKGAAVLAHKINGKEITFVLSIGPKLTMTEAELRRALETKTDAVGTVADGEPQPSAPSESASRAPKKQKKEGN
jgi:hypothetical protein